MLKPWAEVEPMIRDRAYRRLDDDPQILLECDSYPPSALKADLYYARFIGFEDEIVRDGVRLYRPDPVILMMIPTPLRIPDRDCIGPGVYKIDDTVIVMPPDPWEFGRNAEYRFQSAWLTCEVSCEVYDVPVKPGPTHTATVAYVRYRRRV